LRSGVRASFPAPVCQRENAQRRFSLFDFQRTRIANKFAKRIWNSPRANLGGVAEWLCSGLQSRVRRFDSDPRLQLF
jgi:hypothetical protein